MRGKSVLLVGVLLAGCMGAVTHQVYLADGTQGFAITCSGPYANWNTCLQEAGRLCGPGGYREIERHDEKGYNKQGVGYDRFRGADSYSTRSRSMMIACNPPAAIPARK